MNLYGRVLTCILPLLYLVNGSVLANEVFQPNGNVRVAETSRRAAQWLLNRRNSQLHWGHLSNSQVLLALSQSDYFNSSLPEFQLAIAQLDINFLLDRLRVGDLELYSDRLIPLAVTLTSLCRSPTHYYDYDLLDGLLDYRRKTDNFTFASEMLAVCAGDGVILRTDIRRLVWLLNPKMWTGPSLDIDTLSMVLMTTGCVAQHYNHPYILPFADQLVPILISKQQRDGSFNNGNTISTALVVQALRIHGLSINVNSTVQAAVDWIVSAQLEDGSFDSDLMVTSEVVLALSSMGGRAHIHLSRCKDNQTEVTAVSGSSPTNQVSFLIWIGQQPNTPKRQSFSFKVPVNSTVYEALLLAQVDGLLRFETREYSFGHYIVSINNTPELSTTDQRWMIYVLPASDHLPTDKPDSKFLMKTSVSSYKIRGGESILFWYQSSIQSSL
ncbi:cobalamin-binding-like protein [Daphnia pulex]|uniref:Cobalamin-binding-like protein n=1 Tax=Daphnia pulex TaxID=6669 RepID=E9FZT1_DAPPU|nr:cobalamin-binding-like protein [Daphnia pulex]|eukprot:EFX87209.1 cobalamin-binding-like protein [Daphnia pulex]